MISALRKSSVLLVAVLLAACEDTPVAPTGCDVAGACVVEGVDLAIERARLIFEADQPYSAAVGAHVVAPGDSFVLGFTVFNRGTEPSAPVWVLSSAHADPVEIPALQPGERFIARTTLTAPDIPFSATTNQSVRLQFICPTGAVAPAGACSDSTPWYYDAAWENDEAYGMDYHLRVPVLSFEVDVADTIQALVPYHLTVRITNESPFVALHESTVFGFCFADEGYGCASAAGGLVEAPPIMARETRTIVTRLVVPHEPVWIDFPDDGAILPCLLPAATSGSPGDGDMASACGQWVRVAVLPNPQAACDPQLLTPPDTFLPGSGEPDCRHGDDHYWLAVHALDAVAGETYELRAEVPGEGPGITVGVFTLEDRRYASGVPLDAPYRFEATRTARHFILSRRNPGSGSGGVIIERVP